MENTMGVDLMPKTDAEYEAFVDQGIARMKLMQQQMDDDQREIEMLRAETDAILANVMQALKAA